MIQPVDDPVGFVASRPEMFFGLGKYNPEELAAHIAREALLSGVSVLEVSRVGKWWVIHSGTDWLTDQSALEWFQQVVPFPEGGQNACRSEVLATAFADAVVTVGQDGNLRIVKGAEDDALRGHLVGLSMGGRVIAFR
jgi:hypothetical protein